MEMVAKFQPHMVKIRFAVKSVAKMSQYVARRPGTHLPHRSSAVRNQSQVFAIMIKWILILLVIAAVASLLGFGRLAGAAATGAQILIGIVLILFLLVIVGVIAIV
jgi:uncharacterized membrane protein YtjA (UPF0391 family)